MFVTCFVSFAALRKSAYHITVLAFLLTVSFITDSDDNTITPNCMQIN